MAQTDVGIGSPIARKLYSVALFQACARKNTFRNRMTGPAPKQGEAEAKAKQQTSPAYPIVEVRDLTKTAGDTVSVDLFDVIVGKPVMGDDKLNGKMMNLTYSSMDVSVDQYRGGVDTGGRMAQQRTLHNLRGMSMAHLTAWGSRLEDSLCFIHLAGARGYQQGVDWNIPLEQDPEFGNIVVNPILPPSATRRMFAGSASSVQDLGTTDYLALQDIDRIRTLIDESEYPLQPVKLDGDPANEDEPLYCLMVTPRQWHYIQTNTSDQNWRSFLAAAHERGSLTKHPLFLGTTGMWNGILIKKSNRAIRFGQGQLVREYQADGSIAQIEAAVDTDRAILLGGQALANVYAKHSKSGHHWNWHEEETDHGNSMEISTSLIGGKSKLRFKHRDGQFYDHGVITIDTYAPAVNA